MAFFNGAFFTGGFFNEGASTAPTYRKRRRSKAEKEYEEYERNLIRPIPIEEPTPLEPAAINLAEDTSEDDDLLLKVIALMRLH